MKLCAFREVTQKNSTEASCVGATLRQNSLVRYSDYLATYRYSLDCITLIESFESNVKCRAKASLQRHMSAAPLKAPSRYLRLVHLHIRLEACLIMRVSHISPRKLEILEIYRQRGISQTCIHFGMPRSVITDWNRREKTSIVCPRRRRSLRRRNPRLIDLGRRKVESSFPNREPLFTHSISHAH